MQAAANRVLPCNRGGMKTRSIPTSADLAKEAFDALGLRKTLPANLKKRLSGTRGLPTEANADKRATPPHLIREHLVAAILHGLLPPAALQVLLELPSEQQAWSRWKGVVALTASRGQEWDNLTDALLHEHYEHPMLAVLGAFLEHAKDQGFLGDVHDVVEALLRRLCSSATDPNGLNNMKAVMARLVVREIALREAAATLVWNLPRQDVGPSWHLQPPMAWLQGLLGVTAPDIPRTTRGRWRKVTNENLHLQWQSVENLIEVLVRDTHADAETAAVLRLRVGGHLVLRRLGVALQRTYRSAHQQLTTAYTNQVRKFITALENEPSGVSLGQDGRPRDRRYDLRELALLGPLPNNRGGWMVEHVFRHSEDDKVEALTMQSPFLGVLMASSLLPERISLRQILATTNSATGHPLGVSPLLHLVSGSAS